MHKSVLLICLASSFVTLSHAADQTSANTTQPGRLLLEDDFERDEANPAKEDVGNGWSTNSRSRAKGRKQVDLGDGTMHITRADVADHGVSVVHDMQFRNAVIQLKFKLGSGDDLGINIADMKEKSVHAGHICMARIRLNSIELSDLKTGRMELKSRQQRLDGTLSADRKREIATKSERFKVDLQADEWHLLKVRIDGDRMQVAIDGKPVGEFQSEGIAHPTKSRLRLAVNKSAWVDEVRVWSND